MRVATWNIYWFGDNLRFMPMTMTPDSVGQLSFLWGAGARVH